MKGAEDGRTDGGRREQGRGKREGIRRVEGADERRKEGGKRRERWGGKVPCWT